MPKGYLKDGTPTRPPSNKGKIFSKVHRKRISVSNKGKHNYLLGTKWKPGRKKPKKWKLSEKTKRRMKVSKLGENNPSWRGGIAYLPYTVDWTETLRRSIRERDKYNCKICNLSGHIVHHIDYNKENCDVENLITVCRRCHTKTNFNRSYWIRYFENLFLWQK